ncbi:TetR/AcrR family transcriptional regulator [Yinghuangia seranimata]|uniref:TetR/AcrR family transcriptional regulator n=1 Tax=Yinghuangia seranimata TaxID=408067 RepID=UPI00248BDA1D|nr:TetR/AcrR family transcriptional regulator [Yinghuangia seranimata]MDI2128301.1 helix-turn-helix domain-containing protein [Yinghuangia seranimata]
MATTTGPAGAPGAKRADARLNRERVLAAAREVFAESGPDASLNEIARRAGVGPGTLYRHFPNRQALLAAVIQERVDALCAHAGRLAEPGPEGPTADAALAEWLAAFLAHARLNHGIGAAAMAAHDEEFGADCHGRIFAAAASVLERAQREGTARSDVTVDDLVQLVVGLALSANQYGDEAQPARLLALVLDGVHGVAGQARRLGSAASG